MIGFIRRWLDDRRARRIVEEQRRKLKEMMDRLAWEGYMEATDPEEILYWHSEIRKNHS